jgi:hypothetical protein
MSGTRLSDRVRGVRLECKARHVYKFQVGGFKVGVSQTVNTSGIRTRRQNQSHGHGLCVTRDALNTAVRVRSGD